MGKEVNVATLKEKDPSRFQWEHEAWARHEPRYEWWDCLFEGWVKKLAALGVTTTTEKMQFSGFWSQGDGASFTGTVDAVKFFEAHNNTEYPAVVEAVRWGHLPPFTLTRISSRYAHENTVSVEEASFPVWRPVSEGIFAGLDADSFETLVDTQYNDAAEFVLDTCRGLMQDLYHDLEEEYEYLVSEESFVEHCHANEVTFTLEDDEDESET